ncbi:unnamed protein product [Lactuca saligna]|uniref:At2g35280-like TPR domain-containing protein n=1 Tax=Lactuca saligna TaxID=75948 RepID=A0AA35Y669_LACSI|nr:unnamed protein product [Lactuca saligna]
MTYGSLVNMVVAYGIMVSPIGDIWVIVNMVVAYGVMVSPIDDIWVTGQHGSCLWYPWMTYGSLVNMILAYGVMDDIWIIGQHVIGQRGSCLWCHGGHMGHWLTCCKLFRDSVTSDAIYKTIDTNRLRFHPLSVHMYEVIRKCRKLNNPHVLFNDGMAKYFTIGKEISGKQLLQDAAVQGKLDAIFVLGMMLMAEGIERKQEDLIMLNNAYFNTRRSWNIRHTCNKVKNHLVRRKKQIKFHGLRRSCAKHPSMSSYGTTFMYQHSWLLNCDIFLWDACLVKFARMFDVSLE